MEIGPRGTAPAQLPAQEKAMLDTARAFEASFLAEMLKSAGMGSPREFGGGGAGEDAYAGLLVNEYAARLAESGGIGLAEAIVTSLRQDTP